MKRATVHFLVGFTAALLATAGLIRQEGFPIAGDGGNAQLVLLSAGLLGGVLWLAARSPADGMHRRDEAHRRGAQ
jgi:hypothetical protein